MNSNTSFHSSVLNNSGLINQYPVVSCTPAGITGLDQVTQSLFAPSLNEARMPDGCAQYCIAKGFPITENIVINNSDLILVWNPNSDRSRIGMIFYYDNANSRWTRGRDLRIATDLTKFASTRSVTGMVRIISNTQSTTLAILDGTISSVAVMEYPREVAFAKLASFAISQKLCVINSKLSSGQTMIAQPRYHPYEKKFNDTTGFLNIQNDYTKRDPDYLLELNGAGVYELQRTRAHLLVGKELYVDISLHQINPGTGTNTMEIKFQWASLDSAFQTTNTQQTSITSSVYFAANGIAEYQRQICVTGPSDYEFLIGLVVTTSVANSTVEGVIRIWEANRVFESCPDEMKYITYVQGSTGTKNICISGCMDYELVPRSENYSQVAMSPPMGATWVPLEVFNGCLANPMCDWRLVWQGEDYDRFIDTALTPNGSASLIASASDQLGEASILSSIAGVVRKGVGVLKGLGISPARILRKGVDVLEGAGYASSPAALIAGSSSYPTDGLAGPALPYQVQTELSPNGGLVGYASNPDGEKDQSVENFTNLDFDCGRQVTLDMVSELVGVLETKYPEIKDINIDLGSPNLKPYECVIQIHEHFKGDEDCDLFPGCRRLRCDRFSQQVLDLSPGAITALRDYVRSVIHEEPTGLVAEASQPSEPPRGMVAKGLDDDDEEEIPAAAVEEQVKKVDYEKLNSHDIATTFQYTTRYTIASASAIADKIRRYSAFCVVVNKKAYGLATFEFGMVPRTHGQYRNLALWLGDAARNPNKEKWFAKMTLPTWLEDVFIDENCQKLFDRGRDEFTALLTIISQPQMMGLSFGEEYKGQKERYLTLYHPGDVTEIRGTSWSGALLALFIGKDPTVIWELSFSCAFVRDRLIASVIQVGDVPEKINYIKTLNSMDVSQLDYEPYAQAVRSVGMHLNTAHWYDDQSALTLEKNYKILMRPNCTTDIEVLGNRNGIYNWAPQFWLVWLCAYWYEVYDCRSPQMSQYIQDLAATGRLMRLTGDDEKGKGALKWTNAKKATPDKVGPDGTVTRGTIAVLNAEQIKDLMKQVSTLSRQLGDQRYIYQGKIAQFLATADELEPDKFVALFEAAQKAQRTPLALSVYKRIMSADVMEPDDPVRGMLGTMLAYVDRFNGVPMKESKNSVEVERFLPGEEGFEKVKVMRGLTEEEKKALAEANQAKQPQSKKKGKIRIGASHDVLEAVNKMGSSQPIQ